MESILPELRDPPEAQTVEEKRKCWGNGLLYMFQDHSGLERHVVFC